MGHCSHSQHGLNHITHTATTRSHGQWQPGSSLRRKDVCSTSRRSRVRSTERWTISVVETTGPHCASLLQPGRTAHAFKNCPFQLRMHGHFFSRKGWRRMGRMLVGGRWSGSHTIGWVALGCCECRRHGERRPNACRVSLDTPSSGWWASERMMPHGRLDFHLFH